MSTLAGTGKLIRLILRRERLRLSIWVVVLAGVPMITANAFIDLYPDDASREALAATVISSPALTSMLGPLYDSSLGGLVAWRAGVLGAIFVALMAVLTVIRHTREEEETGRRELLGATVVGRHAQLAAALMVTIGAGVLVALLLTAGLTGVGLPFRGSIAFGLGFAGVAAVFAGVGAVAAQLTEAASSARGIAVSVVGLAYLLRVAGDSGGDAVEWLSWISPIGWFSRFRPYAGEVWWILALWLALTVALVAAAVAIASRRDVAAGALPSRPGPAMAAPGLGSPLGLAWRLHRGSVIGWTVGIAVLGIVYGTAGDSIGDMIEGNPQLAEILEQIGGAQGLTDTYFSTVVGIIAIVVSAYAIRAVLRLNVEEEAMRAEYVLATATPRHRFAWSHLIFGLVLPIVILAIAGALGRGDLRGNRWRCGRAGPPCSQRRHGAATRGMGAHRDRDGSLRARAPARRLELGCAGGLCPARAVRPDPAAPPVEPQPLAIHPYPGSALRRRRDPAIRRPARSSPPV